MRAELLGEVVEVRRVGELALHKQERHLRERAVRREVGDRVAAVEEHALVAVDERDARLARRRRGEAGVVGEEARLGGEASHVDHAVAHPLGRLEDRQLGALLLALGVGPRELHARRRLLVGSRVSARRPHDRRRKLPLLAAAERAAALARAHRRRARLRRRRRRRRRRADERLERRDLHHLRVGHQLGEVRLQRRRALLLGALATRPEERARPRRQLREAELERLVVVRRLQRRLQQLEVLLRPHDARGRRRVRRDRDEECGRRTRGLDRLDGDVVRGLGRRLGHAERRAEVRGDVGEAHSCGFRFTAAAICVGKCVGETSTARSSQRPQLLLHASRFRGSGSPQQ